MTKFPKADGDIPQEVIHHVRGGPQFSTTIKTDDEGNEDRTRRWNAPKEVWEGLLTDCSPETLDYFVRNNNKLARFAHFIAMGGEGEVLIQFNPANKHVRLTAKQDQEKFDKELDKIPAQMRQHRRPKK